MILYSITVNAWQPPYGRLRVIQEEANGREIAVTVIGADGQPINFTGKTVSVYLEKPDGTKIYNTCAVSGSTVTISLSAQMTAVYGISNLFELHIVDAESHTLKVTLPPLCIIPSNYDGAIESSNEFSALSEALANVANMQAQINKMEQNMHQTAFPNLLLNSDFAINQRGQTSYSNGRYTADRWYNSSAGTVIIAANTLPNGTAKNQITVSHVANSWNTFSQPFEDFDSRLAGKTAMLSFWLKAQNAGRMRCGVGASLRVFDVTQSWQRYTFAFSDIQKDTAAWTVNGLSFQSASNGISSNTLGSITIAEPQLIYGTYVGVYTPPNPAEEFQKCKRYFYSTASTTTGLRMFGYTQASNESTKIVYPTFDFPGGFREVPAVTLGSCTICGNGITAKLSSVTEIVPDDLAVSLEGLAEAAIGNSQAISGWFDVANPTTFDAEIYG